MRRTVSLLAALMLAATASLLDAPAFGYTEPAISTPDAGTPGHVTFTVTGTDAPYVTAYLIESGSTATQPSGAPAILAVQPEGTAFDLDTWGYADARIFVKPCSGSDYATCSDTPVTANFTATDVMPQVTWPDDVTIGQTDQYPVTISDPDGGGNLIAFWGPTGYGYPKQTVLNRNGTTDVSLPDEGTGDVVIVRCSLHGVCRGARLTRTITVNNRLSAYVRFPQLGTISPTLGAQLEPTLQVSEGQDQAFSLTWSIYDASDQPVAGFSGTITGLLVDGKAQIYPVIDPAGLPDSDDAYQLRMSLSYNDPDFGTMTRSDLTASFYIDTTPIPITAVDTSRDAVYPYRDGYQDSMEVWVSFPIEWGKIAVRIQDSTGKVVRRWDNDLVSGGYSVVWDGRNAAGNSVPDGTYRIHVLLTDNAGNQSGHSGATVRVVRKKVVYRTFRKTVSAAGTQVNTYVGRCSTLTKPSKRGWAGSIGLYSNSKCADGFKASFVESDNSIRVPSAIWYGGLRINTYGGAGASAPRSVAYISYRNFATSEWTDFRMLDPTVTWHSGPSRPATQFVSDAHRILWATFNVKGSAYDIRTYQVEFGYKVLARE